tara:strand:+ start:147 stop:440 length:294 start_codon:yes stop_codon:yes gene_type:complete
MSGYRVKKKPTLREVTSTVLELNNRINSLMGLLSELEKAFSLYIEMNKDNDKFKKFIDKKVKEWNDAKANGKADEPNLQGDTDGESSGTKGVRKKDK